MEDASPMTVQMLEYRLGLVEKREQELEAQIKETDQKHEQFRALINERERKRLLWGISALGTVVMVLAGMIWARIGQNVWPGAGMPK